MELWRFSPGEGMKNSLVASVVKHAKPGSLGTTTKLTLTVIKPGAKWSNDVTVPFTPEQLQQSFPRTPNSWKDEFKENEANGVFRAMRSIELPELRIKLYWAVIHIKTVSEDGLSYQIMDRFWYADMD